MRDWDIGDCFEMNTVHPYLVDEVYIATFKIEKIDHTMIHARSLRDQKLYAFGEKLMKECTRVIKKD